VIFTTKVPKGKADGKLFCKKREVRNLEILPRNPPEPISNNVLIISNRMTLKMKQSTKQSNTKISISLVTLRDN
jgi:hypothetical protein